MIDSSSEEDRDSNERVKNVSNLLVKSNGDRRDSEDGCAYKRRLGDLIFDANFEGGNLGFIERIDEFSYDLMIRPDVANPRHRVWFNFTVANQRSNQCVIFNMVNFSENLNLFQLGLTPCVRCQRKPNWRRLLEDQVFYYKSASHNNRYVLSIAFRFDSFDNPHQFALFFPYTLKTLEDMLTRWRIESCRQRLSHAKGIKSVDLQAANTNLPDSRSHEKLRAFRSKKNGKVKHLVEFELITLAKTILSKSVYMLQVSNKVNANRRTERPKVIIACRQCGNLDSFVSYVCHGLMDYILTQDNLAEFARDTIDFFIFPMIDPDSICVGNSRTDIMGQAKLERKIILENQNIYSNFIAIERQIENIIKVSNGGTRVVIIELCSNLNLIGSRMTGCHFEDSLRMERHLRLPRLVSAFAREFYLENCKFPRDPRESLIVSRDLQVETKNLDHYRLEVGPFGWYRRSLVEGGIVEFDQIEYLRLGKALVCSLLELFRSTRRKKSIPLEIVNYLDSFLPKSNDIDDLMLDQRKL